MAMFQVNDVIETTFFASSSAHAPTIKRYCVVSYDPLGYYCVNEIENNNNTLWRVYNDQTFSKIYIEMNYNLCTSIVLSGAGNPIFVSALPSNHTAAVGSQEPKFKLGDMLQEVANNSVYRYKVISIKPANIWGSYDREYVLERQETEYLPAQNHCLSQEFCENHFKLVDQKADGGCVHDWKVYNSGFRILEYCSKCNKDKT